MSTYYISPQSNVANTVVNGGHTVSTVGSSSVAWSQDYSITGNLTTANATVNITSNGIDLKNGTDITVGGKSLTDAISKIEERLGILNPNPQLEERWDQLKDLRRQYQALEAELLEKEKMWNILKKD